MQAAISGKIEIEIRQGRNAAQAAKKPGIRHLVYGSAGPGHTKTGIEQWDAKIEVTQAMKELGLPLTALRPMAFMELMVDPPITHKAPPGIPCRNSQARSARSLAQRAGFGSDYRQSLGKPGGIHR